MAKAKGDLKAVTGAFLIALLMLGTARAQDTLHICFLYGSKPAKAFRGQEPIWFGGKAGGHVGIRFAPDSILNFVPEGKFHYVGKIDPKHSKYIVSDEASFWGILGGSDGALKTAQISIPIDSLQCQRFQAIKSNYLAQTPYDYAFFGIRCAAAADEILAKLQITRRRSYWGTIFGTFHPKILRNRLARKSGRYGWPIFVTKGSERRIWQR